MGNACAGTIFFLGVEPLSRKGKGTAHIKVYSVSDAKKEINRAIKYATKEKLTSTRIEFSSVSYPDKVLYDTTMYFAERGYVIHVKKYEHTSTVVITWNDEE